MRMRFLHLIAALRPRLILQKQRQWIVGSTGVLQLVPSSICSSEAGLKLLSTWLFLSLYGLKLELVRLRSKATSWQAGVSQPVLGLA
jgi:hypothetical protein